MRNFDGPAALVSRAALVVFAIFYTTFEVLVGIGVGLLAGEVNALPAAERASTEQLVVAFTDTTLLAAFETIGSLAWLVAVAAAGVALFRRAVRDRAAARAARGAPGRRGRAAGGDLAAQM